MQVLKEPERKVQLCGIHRVANVHTADESAHQGMTDQTPEAWIGATTTDAAVLEREPNL